MHVCVPTDLLRNAVSRILPIIDKKNRRPILTYILLSAKNNTLQLSATDLEVSIKVSIKANVEKDGELCVNAKNIFDILRELPDRDITLKIKEDENILKLDCADIKYSLLVSKDEGFPQLIFNKTQNQITIGVKDLLEVIDKTSYAISSDDTRPHLCGIFFQTINSRLRAVATDGHRLSIYDVELDLDEDVNILSNGIIIPRKGISELKKISETYNDRNVVISFDESFLYLNIEEEYFLSIRLIAREYPKYQAVVPSKTTFTLTVDRDLFLNAVKRIKIMSNEKSNGLKIVLTKNEMTIMANHPDLGDATEKIPVKFSGDQMEIGFNARYLLDTLIVFDVGDISFELNNELSPVISKSVSIPDYLGIIMPLKLQT
ncbi:MAG: DNA polymerase III subunit beta [Bacteriovoracaceae bacterium]|nr:DNA polymerase III subunit beta [Bacteriovoracaceae bacterium]